MQLTLNGTTREIPQPESLQHLIDATVRDSGRVIAELNGTIIKRGNWSTTIVKDGDTLELVSFVGGG